jgi:hypothetical protein
MGADRSREQRGRDLICLPFPFSGVSGRVLSSSGCNKVQRLEVFFESLYSALKTINFFQDCYILIILDVFSWII